MERGNERRGRERRERERREREREGGRERQEHVCIASERDSTVAWTTREEFGIPHIVDIETCLNAFIKQGC